VGALNSVDQLSRNVRLASEVLRVDSGTKVDSSTGIQKGLAFHGSAAVLNDCGPSLSEFLDISAVPVGERLAVWRDLVQLTWGPTQVHGKPDTFGHGTILRGSLGEMQAAMVQADPHSVSRTQRQIEQCTNPALYVGYVCLGSAQVAQDGRAVLAGQGEIFCIDNTRPYTLTMPERFRMGLLVFRHRMVGLTSQSTQPLTARTWSGGAGIGVFLSQVMVSLNRHITELSATAAGPLASSFAGLVSTLFAECLSESAMDPSAVRHALVLRIKAYAEEHLDDPTLYSETLARQHGISLRYLQLLFAEQGTSPAKWIRQERLERCCADLRNPQYDHLTVAAIGERRGLPGASHFSRLFRDRYGRTPSEFRRTR
jgi:AraC-like DNA-binding protein